MTRCASHGACPQALPMDELLDALTEGVLVLDGEHRIVYANRIAASLLGYPRNALLGLDLHAGLQPRRADGSAYPPAESPFKWLQRGGAFCFIEDVLWRQDGQPLDVEISATPLAGDPAAPRAVVVFRDIAARRQRQDTLLKAFQDLDALNARLERAHGQMLQNEKLAAVGQLAAGMAHEINNPIGFVSSNLGSLEKHVHGLLRLVEHYEGLASEGAVAAEKLEALAVLKKAIDYDYLREDVQDLLQESRQGVERVRRIVQSLKDFSREGAEYQWAEIDLHHCLETTLEILHRELENRCEIRRDYGKLPPVYCLASEINQVLLGVLLNASQAIAERGQISLRTSQEGSFAVIEISDDGCGIAPEVLPHIFDPFFTTRPVGQGSGMGLSVAYGTVQRHGGDIQIDSQPGRGSRVRILLPIRGRPAGEVGPA